MSEPVAIVWYRRDLRIEDHAGIAAACDHGGHALPLYIHDEREMGDWSLGAASRWWLHHSLQALSSGLEARGSYLHLRRGDPSEVLVDVAQRIGATSVYFERRCEPSARAVEAEVERACARVGIETHASSDALFFEPGTIATGQGNPYQVFTPFWKRCLQAGVDYSTASVQSVLPSPSEPADGLALSALSLLPKVDWATGLRAEWHPGYGGAQEALQCFLSESVHRYAEGRDRPAERWTSGLSPHLHFGEISPRQIASALREVRGEGASSFLRELGWREFSHHLLYHFPHLDQHPLREQFASFPWCEDRDGLRAWQMGQTGYPLVDAGMRQLWQTGWMHNRVRMIVGSFLVKDLLIDWRRGAEWFWDTLVDADLANNSMGWQWVAGCGADAAPFFRIFNPISQGEKFDQEGTYVRRWVPELAQVPSRYIHAPWRAPDHVLRTAGVTLGSDYPEPIVDHAFARQRALDALQKSKA